MRRLRMQGRPPRLLESSVIRESVMFHHLAGYVIERSFDRSFDSLNHNRGKHTGTQGTLIFLRIAQVGLCSSSDLGTMTAL